MIIHPAGAATAALALLNTTHPGEPQAPGSPFPTQVIVCYDRRYARHAPKMNDCTTIIESTIVTGPNPAMPIPFARNPYPGIHSAVPKVWVAPWTTRGTCHINIDVPVASAEIASLVEIQATARAIQMRCVLGEDHLGGMTYIGATGKLLVEILGYPPVTRPGEVQ